MPLLEQAGAAGMGLLLGEINDARQRRQNKKLQEQQIEGNKAMIDYQMQKQYDMWLKTNYGAQKEQMKKAGINPALMYGMGGGGGTTTGNASGSVSSSSATQNPGEMGMGIQLAMMQAQLENIKANTNKTNTEASKIGGVDTQESQQRITESAERINAIRQGITESEAKTALAKLEATLKGFEIKVQGGTVEDRIHEIEWRASKALRELQILDDAQYVSRTTRQARTDAVRAELTGLLLRNTLTEKLTTKTEAEQRLIEREVSNMIQDNMRDWDKMSQENQKILLQSILQKHNIIMDENVVDKILGAIPNIFIPLKGGKK